MLQSLRTASSGLDVETVVVDDTESRGPSWARNQGLDRATGEVVFFADADDAVRPGFFTMPLKLLTETGADFVLASSGLESPRRDYTLKGNGAVRAAMLPAFFGYSFEDVRRWNCGDDLRARREFGTVWRGAFRRDFLEKHSIRFDEGLRYGEDAAFLSECAAYAESTASTDEAFYDYAPGAAGMLRQTLGSDRYFEYKFAALANRKAIDARAGGGLMEQFEASAVFSALELMKARRGVRRYVADPFVADAVRRFPISGRHPLTAVAVTALRALI